jgi:oligopeptide transport system ATP-binding protein
MYAGFIVETATTADVFDQPSHPYTVGLLHSIPRIDAPPGEELLPIEGRPPDMRRAPVGCPFAPRCAWRLDVCWTDNPALRPLLENTRVIATGANATHQIACHNPPTPAEAAAGRPLRDGFVAAPPPGGMVDELSGQRSGPHDSVEGPPADVPGDASPFASAGGLPIEPDEDGGRGRG